MKIWKEVLKRQMPALLMFFVMTITSAAVFLLYDIALEPLAYACVLSLFFLLILLAADYAKEKRNSDARTAALSAISSSLYSLPKADTAAEEDYQQMIAMLAGECERLATKASLEQQDMLDYITAWVHQIKTPISVMRLKLAEDTPEHRALAGELSRIERYVEMVLQYVRLGSTSNDLLIREYDLDDLIREALRRQAAQFVEKRLRLDYSETGVKIVTDQKWFVCILDQLLSNAVKYTSSGCVRIFYQNGFLTVSDTGIGIAPEDLPRIFEMGYTGSNGRLEKQSSGLGLYLAKKAADLLCIPLRAESTPGQGSAFTLDLRQNG